MAFYRIFTDRISQNSHLWYDDSPAGIVVRNEFFGPQDVLVSRIKTWTGLAWETLPVRLWTGTAFVPIKVWSGTEWLA